MTKILSQAGISLADAYNVQGSIAGIESLESREVALVHEMGATIFSERIATFIYRPITTGILQSAAWNTRYIFIPDVVTRLVGITVCVPVAEAGRIDRAQVSVETLSGTVVTAEIPVWMWNAAQDVLSTMHWSDAGGAAASYEFMRPANGPQLPLLLVGTQAHFSGAMIQFRGVTNAFGAGTVDPILQLHVLFSSLQADSVGRTWGLPIPSW